MVKLNKIKLTVLNRNEIADKEQRLLKGGLNSCGCVSVCLQDICACVDEIDSTPNEAAMYKITSTEDREANSQKNLEQNYR